MTILQSGYLAEKRRILGVSSQKNLADYDIIQSKLFGENAIDIVLYTPQFSVLFGLATLADPQEKWNFLPMRLRQFCFADQTANTEYFDKAAFLWGNEDDMNLIGEVPDNHWNTPVSGVEYDQETDTVYCRGENPEGEIEEFTLGTAFELATFAYLQIPDAVKRQKKRESVKAFKNLNDGVFAPTILANTEDSIAIVARVGVYEPLPF